MKPQSKEITCLYCKKIFVTKRHAKYCSVACSNRYRLLGKGEIQPKPCEVCGKVYKPQRRSTRFCSNVCSSRSKSQDPVFLESLKRGCVKRSQRTEYIEKLSEKAKERWNTSEFQEKMRDIFNTDEWIKKSTDNYLTKKYTFPSGKEVFVQGYEDKALDILLEKYTEEDIVVNKQDIKQRLGKITYESSDGKTHQYIPDIYIISENQVIEVKSQWTYKVNEIVNLQKRDAVLKRGIGFEFMIL